MISDKLDPRDKVDDDMPENSCRLVSTEEMPRFRKEVAENFADGKKRVILFPPYDLLHISASDNTDCFDDAVRVQKVLVDGKTYYIGILREEFHNKTLYWKKI